MVIVLWMSQNPSNPFQKSQGQTETLHLFQLLAYSTATPNTTQCISRKTQIKFTPKRPVLKYDFSHHPGSIIKMVRGPAMGPWGSVRWITSLGSMETAAMRRDLQCESANQRPACINFTDMDLYHNQSFCLTCKGAGTGQPKHLMKSG